MSGGGSCPTKKPLARSGQGLDGDRLTLLMTLLASAFHKEQISKLSDAEFRTHHEVSEVLIAAAPKIFK